MPTKPKPEPDDKEQSERFNESEKIFEEVFKVILPEKIKLALRRIAIRVRDLSIAKSRMSTISFLSYMIYVH